MSRFSDYRESVIGLGYDSVKIWILKAAFELDIFERIGTQSKTVLTLAEELKANRDSLELFLNALVSLGFLQARESAYSNSKYGLEIFLKGKPFYIGDIIALQSRSAENWLKLTDSVRSGKPVERPEFFKVDEAEMTDAFARAMQNTAMGHAELLAKRLSLMHAKSLLDLGGGPGIFSIYFLKENPALQATVFDLATTLETTKQFIEQAGLSDRVKFQAGDFNQDQISGTFDVCFLSHIIHGQSEEKNKKLFRKIFTALNPNGKLIVQDFFLNQDKQSPQFPALFALNMLLHTDGGRSYTFDETEKWMNQAGFSSITRSNLNLPRSISLMIGQK